MTTVETGGALWSQDGMYTISAFQGAASNYQTSAEIEIADGHVIPEFGVIAAMILAVAIINHCGHCKDKTQYSTKVLKFIFLFCFLDLLINRQ